MELQVGVKVLLRNSKGKYLLVRRSSTKYPEVDIGWDMIGGRINPGTKLLSNLKREVKEETKLDLKSVDKILGVQDILRVKGKHVVRISYLGKATGRVKLDSENVEYKWFTLEELRKIPKRDLDLYFADIIKFIP